VTEDNLHAEALLRLNWRNMAKRRIPAWLRVRIRDLSLVDLAPPEFHSIVSGTLPEMNAAGLDIG
jgi:hypothetical protein